VTVGGAGEAIERVIRDVELHHAAAHVSIFSFCVGAFMPWLTRVVHEAGRPSCFNLHEAQATGAERFELLGRTQLRDLRAQGRQPAAHDGMPAGTVTSSPSIVSVTSLSLSRRGVPRSDFVDES